MLTRSTDFLGPCVASTISARGAPVHGGAAPGRSSRAASTRRDDARCCAPPNASRATPSRHQPAAPDAASALSSSNRAPASQRAPRGVKNTINYQISSINSRYFWRFFHFNIMLTRRTDYLGPCVASTISARGAPVHGGVALWRSSRAASTRRDDARCCAPPNASRAAPSRH